MLVTAAVIYWRIPRPAELPGGATRTAVATVRRTAVADHIWSGHETSGQSLRQPFQMADLEFTPVGWTESVHALDRLDVDSVPGLREGSTVRLVYSGGDPRLAHIDSGTRTYAENALTYLLELDFGAAAVVLFLVLPILVLADRLLTRLGAAIPSPNAVLQRFSEMPPDDPRRKRMEEILRGRYPK
jgi:hypothetical protein